MSSGASSNAAAVKAYMHGVFDGIDFTLPGRQGSIGEDLLIEAADGIIDQSRGQTAPDGTPWDENRGKYGEKKRDRGIPIGIGPKRFGTSRDGMLSANQVRGRMDIRPDEATMTYGADEGSRKKGEWFTAGSEGAPGCQPSGAKGQPPRPFYAMSDETKARVIDLAREFIKGHIRRKD